MGSTTTDRRIGLNSGAAFKVPCKAASTANLVLSGEQTVDGVACVTGDRVLVKNQTDQTANGIWVVSTASWTRDLDFDGNLDAVTGTQVMTLNGNTNSNSFWRLATIGAINFGSSLISFARSFVNDSTLISFIQSGVGAILLTVQDELRLRANVMQYGGVMNDSSAGVRTANRAALLAVMTAAKRIYIPEGIFWTDGDIEVPSGVLLYGAGKQSTTVKGDGDIFKVSVGVTAPIYFQSFQIQNDTVRGKLIKIIAAVATGGIICRDMYFNTAFNHFYASALVVGQYFYDCTFLDASSNSREYAGGAYVCHEFTTYTWNSAAGVYMHSADTYSCSFNSCVFEQLQYAAVTLDTSTTCDIENISFNSCHWEACSLATPAAVPYVVLNAGAAHRMRAIQFNSCSFFTTVGTLTQFVTITPGAGVIAEITFNGGQFFGNAQPSNDYQYVTFNQTCFNAAPTYSPRSLHKLPLTVNSGAVGVVSATGGVNPLSTPSSAWNMDFTQNTAISIANNGTYDLAAGSGLLVLGESAGQVMGLLFLAIGIVTVVTNATSNITNAFGTASKLNVFYNAGTTSYRIENKTGATVNLYLSMQRVRAAN